MSSGAGPVEYIHGIDPGASEDSDGGTPSDAEVFITTAAFAYSTVSPVSVREVTANEYVVEARLVIRTTFDVPATLTLGEDGATDRLMQGGNVDPQEAGAYGVWPDYRYPGNDTIKLYISAPGASQGAGEVVLVTTRS